MTTDNPKSARQAPAGEFNEADLNVIGITTAQTSFAHEALSEAFGERHQDSTNAEQSFAQLNHTALTGLFSGPRSERPSPTSFDEAFAEALSVGSNLSGDTHSSTPGFDYQMFAELLSDPPPASTTTNPSQPSFDHQALAEMLADSRADPINAPPSPLGFNANSSHLDQGDYGEPVTEGSTGSSPADALPSVVEEHISSLSFFDPSSPPETNETISTTHPVVTSTHLTRSALEDVPSTTLEHEQLSLSISDEAVDGGLLASDVMGSQGGALGTSAPQAPSLPNEDALPVSIDTETSPLIMRTYGSTPTDDYLLRNVNEEAEAAAVPLPPLDAESTRQQHLPTDDNAPPVATSETNSPRPHMPVPSLAEAALSADAESSLYLDEASTKTRSGWSTGMASAVSPVAPSPSTSFENVRPQELRRLLATLSSTIATDSAPALSAADKQPTPTGFSTQMDGAQPAVTTASSFESKMVQPRVTEHLINEILSPASSHIESFSFTFESEISAIPIRGEVERSAPAIDPVAASLPSHAATEWSMSLPLDDLPALMSTDARSSDPDYEQNAYPSSPFRQEKSIELSADSSVAVPDESKSLAEHGSPLLTALHVLNSKPSPPFLGKRPSASAADCQADKAVRSMKPSAHSVDSEIALAHPPRWQTPEMHSAVSADANFLAPVFERDHLRPLASDQPINAVVMTMAQPALTAHSDNTGSIVRCAEDAKLLLDELDLNTAIHLRWAMRDIRGNRTKFSPVSHSDLKTLVNLGLIEMRGGLPRLTDLGVLALD